MKPKPRGLWPRDLTRIDPDRQACAVKQVARQHQFASDDGFCGALRPICGAISNRLRRPSSGLRRRMDQRCLYARAMIEKPVMHHHRNETVLWGQATIPFCWLRARNSCLFPTRPGIQALNDAASIQPNVQSHLDLACCFV